MSSTRPYRITLRIALDRSCFASAALHAALLILLVSHSVLDAQTLEPIAIRIPPAGIKLSTTQLEPLKQQLQSAAKEFKSVEASPYRADVGALLKALDLAIVNNEFYSPKDLAKAASVLREAEFRIANLKKEKHPWTAKTGLLVRGYRSAIDHSYQPYGLEIPDGLDLAADSKRKLPLYVWLHGRGDKTTDLHFIHQRMTRAGRVRPHGAIVVHPFGRHCMGFKSAGEIDVLDVVEEVKRNYPIDQNRVVLMGFSMGGAGAWHVGAHYADRWAAVSPGAGFAETARYNRLTPDKFPAWYEQKLWGLYDAPGYVRNLFNLPVTAYSGEVDKQIQAARVMEEAFLSQGRTLPHLIGPGMGHKYHPETLKQLMERMRQAAAKGRPAKPTRVRLQTRTLRYAKQFWLTALRLDQHWKDSRIDGLVVGGELRLTTTNVRAFRIARTIAPNGDLRKLKLIVNGQPLAAPAATSDTAASEDATIIRQGGSWRWLTEWSERTLAKRPGQQGPIDDAFLEPFLIVRPTGREPNAARKRWVDFEINHLLKRWTTLYRGRAPMKDDVDVSERDLAERHLVVFGTPDSNSVLRRALEHPNAAPPIRWTQSKLELGDRSFDANTHLPLMIYPNPLQPNKYLVVNSGPTHREGHDRTNSLQNPKLPDWAIIDIRQPPSDVAAGRVVDANFFDETWQLRPANAR